MEIKKIVRKDDGTILEIGGEDKIERVLKNYPNYNGYRVDGKVISVYVEQKLPLTSLAAQDVLPEKIGSFDVKVFEVKRPSIHTLSIPSQATNDLQGKFRGSDGKALVPGNVAGGNELITAGTIGGVVYDSQTNEFGWFTNTHVACPSVRSDLGTENRNFLQPGPYFGGVPVVDKIGYTARAVKMPVAQTAFNDCAFIKSSDLNNQYLSAYVAKYSAIMEQYTGYKLPVGVMSTAQVPNGAKYFTISCMLGYKEGSLVSTGDNYVISYGSDGNVTHSNCLTFTPISIGGSSGSWIYAIVDGKPYVVAYLFAGSATNTIAHDIKGALDLLTLTPVLAEGGAPTPDPNPTIGSIYNVDLTITLPFIGKVPITGTITEIKETD